MNAVDALRHEFLTDVAEAAERTARGHGIDPAVAEQVGCAVADMLCAEYPGIRIYIAADLGYKLAPRDREICLLRSEGKSLPWLAKEFGLSEERIRQIIKRRDVRDPDFGQGKLFEEPTAGQ